MYGYGHGSMPMPQYQKGPGGRGMPPSTHSQSTSSGHMPMPMGHGYAGTSYSPQPARRTVDNEMDRGMDALITDLKNLVQSGATKDLEQLLSNEDKINSLIGDSEKVKQLQTNREKLIESNKDRAVFNMSLEPDLSTRKEELTEAVLKQTTLTEEYIQLRRRLEELSSNFSMDTTLALLQAAMSEKEIMTEAMSDKLLNGEIPVEDFLEAYLTERKNYHERRIKSEKMSDIIRRGQIQQQGQNYFPTGYGRY